jgi:broad specificity phosphatase PhoE
LDQVFPKDVTLYVVRHGETDWNHEGRLQGQRDIPLNATGEEGARESGRRLLALRSDVEQLPFKVSPLLRARQTANLMREVIGLPSETYILEPDLRELTFGDWEGMIWREIVAKTPHKALSRSRDKWNYIPPHGENYQMLLDRVKGVIAPINCDTVIVAHGGVSRVLLAWLCGMEKKKAALTSIFQDRVLVIKNGVYRWA